MKARSEWLNDIHHSFIETHGRYDRRKSIGWSRNNEKSHPKAYQVQVHSARIVKPTVAGCRIRTLTNLQIWNSYSPSKEIFYLSTGHGMVPQTLESPTSRTTRDLERQRVSPTLILMCHIYIWRSTPWDIFVSLTIRKNTKEWWCWVSWCGKKTGPMSIHRLLRVSSHNTAGGYRGPIEQKAELGLGPFYADGRR